MVERRQRRAIGRPEPGQKRLARADQVGLPLAGCAQAGVESKHGVDGYFGAVYDIERLGNAVVAQLEIPGGESANRPAALRDEHVNADGDGAGRESLAMQGTRQQDARRESREDQPSSHGVECSATYESAATATFLREVFGR